MVCTPVGPTAFHPPPQKIPLCRAQTCVLQQKNVAGCLTDAGPCGPFFSGSLRVHKRNCRARAALAEWRIAAALARASTSLQLPPNRGSRAAPPHMRASGCLRASQGASSRSPLCGRRPSLPELYSSLLPPLYTALAVGVRACVKPSAAALAVVQVATQVAPLPPSECTGVFTRPRIPAPSPAFLRPDRALPSSCLPGGPLTARQRGKELDPSHFTTPACRGSSRYPSQSGCKRESRLTKVGQGDTPPVCYCPDLRDTFPLQRDSPDLATRFSAIQH